MLQTLCLAIDKSLSPLNVHNLCDLDIASCFSYLVVVKSACKGGIARTKELEPVPSGVFLISPVSVQSMPEMYSLYAMSRLIRGREIPMTRLPPKWGFRL